MNSERKKWVQRTIVSYIRNNRSLTRFFVGCLALLVCQVEAADKAVDSGNKQRIDRHNQLQLRTEQETYRQSVEPLSPADRQNLELQFHQQRLQQQNLQLRQDQRLQAERHKHRINPSFAPNSIYRPGPNTPGQVQLQQQQQRLQMRMQRNTWSYPRNYLR